MTSLAARAARVLSFGENLAPIKPRVTAPLTPRRGHLAKADATSAGMLAAAVVRENKNGMPGVIKTPSSLHTGNEDSGYNGDGIPAWECFATT